MALELEAAPATETKSNVLSVLSETIVLAVSKNLTTKSIGFGEYKEGNALYKRSNPVTKVVDGAIVEDASGIDTEILLTLNVTYPIFNDFAGVKEIIEEAEAINLLNAGAYTKLIGQIRAKFTAVTEAGDLVNTSVTELSYEDCASIIAEPLKRQKQTTVQKASKVLAALSPAEMTELLKSMGIL